MGYDQNNDYYSNGDQSWRDQTNVYQTQREQPTPMGRRSPRRKSGWLKGILAVLLVVAISFGAFYLMRNVGVRLERTEDGVTLSMTNRSKQAEPEQASSQPPSPSASAQTEMARAATDNAAAHTGRVCRLGHEAQHRLKPGKLRHDVFRRGGRAVLTGYLQLGH